MNRRNTVLTLLALGAAPHFAIAQQAIKVWRIGYLSPGSGPTEYVEAFREQLRSLGYVEGRNLLFEYRWSGGKAGRLPELAAELVRLKVDVIVTPATYSAEVVRRATSTIPIVMAAASDPVGAGVIASLARPGGNVTGISILSTDLAGKRVQLLREILPKATRMAVLVVSGSTAAPLLVEQTRTAAQQLGISIIVQEASGAEALAAAFAAMQRERAQALVVQLSPFTHDNRERIVELAARLGVPSIFEARGSVDAGGLLSYGPNLLEVFRRAAYYVDRIFKGAKPADLPVEQPTKFEMVINLKTAKALGLTIPQSVLARADEVIR
jgi:putative ABC transport system substrate-binding protein